MHATTHNYQGFRPSIPTKLSDFDRKPDCSAEPWMYGTVLKLLLTPPASLGEPGKADFFELSQCWHCKERLPGPRKGFYTLQNLVQSPPPPKEAGKIGAARKVSKYIFSGLGKGVITKGVFHWRNLDLEFLESLNSLESLENVRILLCFPQSGGSLESLNLWIL